ncbi:hypothetical protein J421_5790 (plasmid) [Gemmatirosa kalamazoonensis]|uniref:Secreted protein n=1 Tax=Gemmatirosa kalamazoonensis TaxID=861299 RepID=W0RSP0_9BACT|nr:hypothetical protein [Gemmatirosa kalamazoonensis]AHG93325.1 hypothetical protein J421_5790 [Gemmatirosa kalamazoonensis]
MRTRPTRSTLGIALTLLCLVARPAAAQSPTASPAVPPSTVTVGSTRLTRWDARPVGRYDVELALPDGPMPVTLTVSDSAGRLTATFWKVGDRDGHEMSVTVKDTDLLLHAETPRGPLDIVLQRQGERVAGRWTLGADHGSVQGKVASP